MASGRGVSGKKKSHTMGGGGRGAPRGKALRRELEKEKRQKKVPPNTTVPRSRRGKNEGP